MAVTATRGREEAVECSVVVLGGGIAGSIAASRAAELGADVILLEKDKFFLGDGNTLMTSGAYFTAGASPRSSSEVLYNRAMAGGVADPQRAKAWSENCSRAIDWLASAGVAVREGPNGNILIEPESSISMAPVYRMDVGMNILTKLRTFFEARQGVVSTRTRGLRLLMNGTVVEGVEAEEKDGRRVRIKSGATVLATGGFQANADMLREHIGRHADRCRLRGSSSARGEGFKMAVEAGAKAANLGYFYGHLQSAKALTDDRFWPYPRVDTLVEDGVLVSDSGERLFDEGRGDIALSNEVAKLDDVTSTSLVFDAVAWERARGDVSSPLKLPSPNPWLEEKGGGLCAAETLVELGRRLGVNPTRLETTVREFNAAAEAKTLKELAVPRTNLPKPIAKPPFYGLRVVPGITFTMGGVMTTGKGEVLTVSGEPIAGLFAAGDVTGGLQGGYNGGYTGGLSQAIVTGLLAGEGAYHFSKSLKA